MGRLSILWQNEYSRWVLIFALLYVVTNSLPFSFNNFDYIIIVYLFIVDRIDEENALSYALLFGLVYDLHFRIYLGVGVILFMILNFAKVNFYQMLNMSKFYIRAIYKISVMVVYVLLTLLFMGFPSSAYWQSALYYLIVNLAAYVIALIAVGGIRAFRDA